jgi:hypothetical protein
MDNLVYNKDYFGFVYCWIDLSNNKKYIGSHHGNLSDRYKGSGILFKRAYKLRPEFFIRNILEFNTTKNCRSYTRELEQKHLNSILDIKNNSDYYNLSNNATGSNGPNLGKTKKTDIGIKTMADKIRGRNKNTHSYLMDTSNRQKELIKNDPNRMSAARQKGVESNKKKWLSEPTEEMIKFKKLTSERMKNNKNTLGKKSIVNKEGVIKKVFSNSDLLTHIDWQRGTKWRDYEKETSIKNNNITNFYNLLILYILIVNEQYEIQKEKKLDRKHTLETKIKISNSKKGKMLSETQKRKMRENSQSRVGNNNTFYNKQHTEENKKKIGNRPYKKGKDHYMYGKQLPTSFQSGKDHPKSIQVYINGTWYGSIAEATRNTGLSQRTIKKLYIK